MVKFSVASLIAFMLICEVKSKTGSWYECNEIAVENNCRINFLEKEGTCLVYDCQGTKSYCESGCVYGFTKKNWVCAPRDVCYDNDPGSGGFIGIIVSAIVAPFRFLYSLLLVK